MLADDAVRFVLVLLLVPVLGLTFWEVRERGFERKAVQWWLAFAGLTHVVGYLLLRTYGMWADRRAS